MPDKFWFVNKICIESGQKRSVLARKQEWVIPAQGRFLLLARSSARCLWPIETWKSVFKTHWPAKAGNSYFLGTRGRATKI